MRKRDMQRIIDEQQELIDAYRELEWELLAKIRKLEAWATTRLDR